jgi:hypothetical protein
MDDSSGPKARMCRRPPTKPGNGELCREQVPVSFVCRQLQAPSSHQHPTPANDELSCTHCPPQAGIGQP